MAFVFVVSSCSTGISEETKGPSVSSIVSPPATTGEETGGGSDSLPGRVTVTTLDPRAASLAGQLSDGWTPVPFLETDGTPAVTALHQHALLEMEESLVVFERFVWGAAGINIRVWRSDLDGLSWSRWADGDTAFAGDRLGGERLIFWGPKAWTAIETGIVVVGATTTSERKPDPAVPTVWFGSEEGWEVEDLDWPGYLTDVISYEGQLVAAGVQDEQTRLWTSEDGHTWTEASKLGDFGYWVWVDLDMTQRGALRTVVSWSDEMEHSQLSHFECPSPNDCRPGTESAQADTTLHLCGSNGPVLRVDQGGLSALLLETPAGQARQLPLPLGIDPGYRDELWFTDSKLLADGRIAILGATPIEPGNKPRGELIIWLHEPVNC